MVSLGLPVDISPQSPTCSVIPSLQVFFSINLSARISLVKNVSRVAGR